MRRQQSHAADSRLKGKWGRVFKDAALVSESFVLARANQLLAKHHDEGVYLDARAVGLVIAADLGPVALGSLDWRGLEAHGQAWVGAVVWLFKNDEEPVRAAGAGPATWAVVE
jgi:hypothetical protein